MNSVNIMGRICNDLEIKVSSNGTEVLNFTVAVDRGKDKPTNFIRCVAFKNTAVFINNYFRKGKMIAINGSLDVSTYDDKEGHKRESVKVIAERVYFCGDKSAEAPSGNEAAGYADINIEDDELPF